MNIAIVGSGISGLTAAYLLQHKHRVTVFEAAPEIGGHTATRQVRVQGQSYNIDTGFIVFNDRTYPNFIKLLNQLGVRSQPTDMSFSVSCEHSGLEYNGTSLNGVFAQRRNLVRPAFLGMLRDILRFNREAIADLERGNIEPRITLGDYLAHRGYGEWFINQYLIPMGAAIWSSGREDMLRFPLLFFVRFFKNHGLLSVNDRPQWRVIEGGSNNYLPALVEGFRERILVNSAVEDVVRSASGVSLRAAGKEYQFEQIIFACHSDQALAMLKDANTSEKDILGAIPYQANDVVLHTDARLLPDNQRAWACWNYRIKSDAAELATLSYNMNMLQGIEAPETFCVTLNDSAAIDPDKVLGRYRYSHPVFSLQSVSAAQRWQEINGVNKTWFCGAYWANGFHEDGCSSAIRVATELGADW